MGATTTDQTKDQIVSHLQFLGYDVSKEEKFIRARHSKKPNLIVRVFSDGALHTSIWGTSDYAKGNRLALLEYVNALNQGAAIARYYADKDIDLIVESWYSGDYDRTNYARFLELCDSDFEKLIKISESGRFLK
jgi:phage gp46-like protein